MGYLLALKFKGKEEEILASVRKIGINATKDIYGVKTRNTFKKYLSYLSSEGLYPEGLYPFPRAKIAQEKAGVKAKWLKENRDFVLKCLELWGEDFVMDNLGLSDVTLDDFIRFDKRKAIYQYGSTNRPEGAAEIERIKVQAQILKEQCLENPYHSGRRLRAGAEPAVSRSNCGIY